MYPQGHKAVRAQFAACLLCLLIVGACLDGLPDPPAVKPRDNLKYWVSQLHSQAPFAVDNRASDCSVSALHFHISLFSFGQIFEGQAPSYDSAVVQQAAGPSPPCVS
jgi:hypothetical protein